MLQSGPRRVRERSALALASALHVTALLSLWAWTIHRHLPSDRASTPRATAEAGDREVEVDTTEPRWLHLPSEAGDPERVAVRNARASAIRMQRSPFRTRAQSPASDGDEKSEPRPRAEVTDPTASAAAAVQK